MDDVLQSSRKPVFYIKRTIGIILLLAMSATFFFSAYSKLYDNNAFDSFQWTFLDLGISSIFAAEFVARMMIGMEIAIGLFLLFHIYLKAFTYRSVIVVLSIFIIYLLVVLLKQGNTGNCGCFGDKLAMKPLTAIWKNLIMIAVTILLMYIYPVRPYRNQEYVLMLLALAAFSTPFLLNFMYYGTGPEKTTKQVDLALLYKYDTIPQVELRTGKHIIAFMSLTCPHCKKAAYLMQVIYHEHPDIPMFLVLDGPELYLKKFFDETHAEQVPHIFYKHSKEFVQLSGSGVPAIYWVNNGKAEYQSNYYQMDPKYMYQWLDNRPLPK